MPRSLTGDLLRLSLAAALGAALLGSFATLRIWQVGQSDERDHAVDAVVVLGAAQYDGRPSPIFRARLDHAVELVLNGVAPLLVVTGGRQSAAEPAEADVARVYAIDRGVPAEAILAEREGHDTLSSLRAVARLLREHGLERALFVSDRPHLLRIRLIALDLGIGAYTSATRSSPLEHDLPSRLGATLHELGALGAYLLLGR
ncbi:MAG TPA: YdcF family protein [Candidatus Limnocylindrales bacterium]|nr:YdcF family protein [Candidatus Limnocylindrales bacterium]